MKLPELIENIIVDDIKLSNKEYTMIQNHYDDLDFVKASEIFLKGIGNRHGVNGHTVYKLWGIIDFYNREKILTRDQTWFVIHTLIENWNQIGLEMRCALNL